MSSPQCAQRNDVPASDVPASSLCPQEQSITNRHCGFIWFPKHLESANADHQPVVALDDPLDCGPTTTRLHGVVIRRFPLAYRQTSVGLDSTSNFGFRSSNIRKNDSRLDFSKKARVPIQ
ncbi:hypothetical protein [Rhodopirellula baltica]